MNLLDIIFPKKCFGCSKFGKYICSRCLIKVPQVGWASSRRYHFFYYKGVIRKAILALKYKFVESVADELVEIIFNIMHTDYYFLKMKKPVLIPIPSQRQREYWRGYNQSELVARKLANKIGWSLIKDALLITRKISHQTGLKREERVKNMDNAFKINDKYANMNKDQTIIIFDDVLTTGKTVYEAMKVFKKASFSNVYCLTLARS